MSTNDGPDLADPLLVAVQRAMTDACIRFIKQVASARWRKLLDPWVGIAGQSPRLNFGIRFIDFNASSG